MAAREIDDYTLQGSTRYVSADRKLEYTFCYKNLKHLQPQTPASVKSSARTGDAGVVLISTALTSVAS